MPLIGRRKWLLGVIVVGALLGGAQAAVAANLAYLGGPVASSMKGVLVDWGPNINPVYTNETTGDPGLIRYLAANSGSTGDIGGVLAQYMDSSGQNAVNAASYGQQYEITPSVTSTTVLNSQIQSELVNQVQAGHLPRPSGSLQTVYLVLFPGGDTECLDTQPAECSGSFFCAYHGSTALPDGTTLLYAVLPDNLSGSMTAGCGIAPTLFDDHTAYLSHEWAETVTDPLGNSWADGGYEIGDKCRAQTGTSGAWTVQLEWSNLDGACVAAEPAYNAPIASFPAPSTGAPGQRLSFDASGSSDPARNGAAISGTSYAIPSGIARYAWDWGDGASSAAGAAAIQSHSFASSGNYEVSLTVTDRLGFTSTVTHDVVITTSPTTSPQPAPVAGSGIGLQTSTTATSIGGTVNLAPTVLTGRANRVTNDAASVSGTVDPRGVLASYHVEFGTSSAYGHSTAPYPAGAGTANIPVSMTLSGLRARTLYHYRVVATSAAGTAVGSDRTLTTAGAPAAAPRFNFHVRSRAAIYSALRGRLKVTFTCSKACSARFALTVAPVGVTGVTPAPVTLALTHARIYSRGSGSATIRFLPAVARRLARYEGVKLMVSGYALGRGDAPSAPSSRPLTLTS